MIEWNTKKSCCRKLGCFGNGKKGKQKDKTFGGEVYELRIVYIEVFLFPLHSKKVLQLLSLKVVLDCYVNRNELCQCDIWCGIASRHQSTQTSLNQKR